MQPSAAPVEESNVIWMIKAVGSESGGDETDPIIDITFITAATFPWTLLPANVSGTAFHSIIQFHEQSSWTCNIKGKLNNCQRWFLSYFTTRDCDTNSRQITAGFWSKHRNEQWFELVYMDLAISGSSAFECAHNLGEFTLTTDTLLSTDGMHFTVPSQAGDFYLDEYGYIKLIFSSGATIKTVNLEQVTIKESSVPQNVLCDTCLLSGVGNLTILNSNHTNYQVRFLFDEATFSTSASVTFTMYFAIEYDFSRRRLKLEIRRRLDQTQVQTSVMLSLKSRFDEYLPFDNIFDDVDQSDYHNDVETLVDTPNGVSSSSSANMTVMILVSLLVIGSCCILIKKVITGRLQPHVEHIEI